MSSFTMPSFSADRTAARSPSSGIVHQRIVQERCRACLFILSALRRNAPDSCQIVFGNANNESVVAAGCIPGLPNCLRATVQLAFGCGL